MIVLALLVLRSDCSCLRNVLTHFWLAVLALVPQSCFGAPMHRSRVSIGAAPCLSLDAATGPSRVPTHVSQRAGANEGVESESDQCLLSDPCCIANGRRVYLFDGDAHSLRHSCALHGMDPRESDDMCLCFRWFIHHLFTGAFARSVDIGDDVAASRQCSACVVVVIDGRSALLLIVSYLAQSVLTHILFYSTNTLSEIVNVFSPDSLEFKGSEDRGALVTRLRTVQSTVGTDPVAEALTIQDINF